MDAFRQEQSGVLQKVLGVLVPYERDEHFNILKVSIACAGEREVVVENLPQHIQLLEFLREPILLEGLVTRNGNIETINVKRVIPFVKSEFFNSRKMK
ncbi:hypothetical protein [Halodesulfovibrio marinisediminis]|uniref:Uncharacterized protein n=1 Tax=Halodesulfovibrio marinisediminis DSM 17456 TaxID=1121457 RepID=A0A1N6EBM4_9BACT|nr:hypothetical protein [Halodesulfovibrio marinisediminis]SIN80371.1 hypothetical protein SAMN02745161_0862 [Halodesulfovibrio marinisediminis DSM 17456]